MKHLTGEPAVMWGKTKVGFGRYHYRGKTSEGDWFHVGFSPRKQDLVLYLHCELEKQAALLEKLGKHKIGKSRLYIKKFEDVHVTTLKKLIMKAYRSPAIAGATIDELYTDAATANRRTEPTTLHNYGTQAVEPWDEREGSAQSVLRSSFLFAPVILNVIRPRS